MGTILSEDLAKLMDSGRLYALFDVRERGEFNERQIAGATSLPRSQIEFRITALVPDRQIPLIVYDEGGDRARPAAATLADLGYEQVSVLDGGLGGWQQNGGAVASGVNVPSKAFGEKVQHERNVPELTPEDLKLLKERSAQLVILDVRTPEEYRRFCIPGGTNVPGGDLILWADELKRRRDAAVVVNCAGRTRSIIGAAALTRLGLANVRALRNGTMGWVLAGFELEHKPGRQAPAPPPESRTNATALARRIASEERIPWVTAEDLAISLTKKNRMHYLIDVRTEDEYAAGHVPESLNVPGGQAVQRADDFIAVRNAPIFFISQESARAVMAAYWYRQMGFADVTVLDRGLNAWSKACGGLATGVPQDEPLGFAAARKAVRWIGAPALRSRMAESALLILDVGASNDFESAHLPGARWISRGWLETRLPDEFADHSRAIVASCPDGRQSAFAARTLEQMGYTDVRVLEGGVRAWSAQGFATEEGSAGCLVEPNDVVLSPSIRGNKEEMRRYLDWEVNLNR